MRRISLRVSLQSIVITSASYGARDLLADVRRRNRQENMTVAAAESRSLAALVMTNQNCYSIIASGG